MLSATSTAYAPWYVVPADHKWFARICAAAVLAHTLIEIDPQYPTVKRERPGWNWPPSGASWRRRASRPRTPSAGRPGQAPPRARGTGTPNGKAKPTSTKTARPPGR